MLWTFIFGFIPTFLCVKMCHLLFIFLFDMTKIVYPITGGHNFRHFPPQKSKNRAQMNCAEIVGVRTFLTHECGCGPHCGVRTAHHTTVRVVLKPNH